MNTETAHPINVQRIRLMNEICEILLKGEVPPASVAYMKEVVLSNMDEYDLIKTLIRYHRKQVPRYTYAQLAERYHITIRQAKYAWKTRK